MSGNFASGARCRFYRPLDSPPGPLQDKPVWGMIDYLIAPPGQDVFVFGFVAERTRYKKQCKHTSKKASKTKLKKSKTRSRMIGERIKNHPETLQNRPQIDPKWSENEAKRDKKSNNRLQDDLGGPRRPSSRLSCPGHGPTWNPKLSKKCKKTL